MSGGPRGSADRLDRVDRGDLERVETLDPPLGGHHRLAGELTERLVATYGSLRIGDPRDPETLVGPLIDAASAAAMTRALDAATVAEVFIEQRECRLELEVGRADAAALRIVTAIMPTMVTQEL